MKTVGELLRPRPLFFVRPDASVHQAVRYMAEKKVGAVTVLSGDRLVGIFSERDVMNRVVLPRKDIDATKVRDVMTTDVFVASPTDSIDACVQAMHRRDFRHLPIVEGGRLIALVSLRELLQNDLDVKDGEIRAMEEYIRYTPHSGTE
ncbi:MAG TPA: CBS domain-containing protein [Planctomycetota bacterium]|nr:CBS domain-containing protein [Planctomycetota bacterium]